MPRKPNNRFAGLAAANAAKRENARERALQNDVDMGYPEGAETWPTRQQAANILGCSRMKVSTLVSAGELQELMVNGVKRYNPEQIENLKPNETANQQNEAVDALVKALDVQRLHNEKLIEALLKNTAMIGESARQISGANESTLKLLSERVGQLEGERFKLYDVFESALTLRSEREIAKQQTEAQERRKDRMVEQFERALPIVVEQVKDSIIARDGREAIELLKSMTPEQVDMLAEAKLVSDEQAARLKRIAKGESSNG